MDHLVVSQSSLLLDLFMQKKKNKIFIPLCLYVIPSFDFNDFQTKEEGNK